MCGIFGYISKSDEFSVHIPTIENLGLDNESRGAHACGVAWIDDSGRLQHAKRTGPIQDHTDMLHSLEGARVVIGHTRWATHGSPKRAVNNHPHLLDDGDGYLVHNGVILNHLDLIAASKKKPLGECDTEGLCLLASSKTARNHAGKDVVRRLKWAVGETSQSGLAVAALWRKGRAALIRAEDRPLWIGETKRAWWFSSLREFLPGRQWQQAEFTSIEFIRENGITSPVQTKLHCSRSVRSQRYAFADGSKKATRDAARAAEARSLTQMPLFGSTPVKGGVVNEDDAARQRAAWEASMLWRKGE